jgi:hypothetical protein
LEVPLFLRIFSIFTFLVIGQTAFANPAQQIELGTEMTLSSQVINARTPGEHLFIQNKAIVAKNVLNSMNPYCEIYGSNQKAVRAMDSISYYVGNMREWVTKLQFVSNGANGFSEFYLECQNYDKYEMTTEELSAILGDLVQFKYVFSDDIGSLRNLSNLGSVSFTLLDYLELPNVTYSQPPLVLKDGQVLKKEVPNSIRFENQYTSPLVYNKGTSFIILTDEAYIVNQKAKNKNGIERTTYSIVKVKATNNQYATPFRLFLFSDRNAEMSLEELKRNLGPNFKFD